MHVAHIAMKTLQQVAVRDQAAITTKKICDFLNGRNTADTPLNGGDYSSLWSRARVATVRLSREIKIEWKPSGNADNDIPTLNVNGSLIDENVEYRTKGAVRAKMTSCLANKPSQGKVFKATSLCPASNNYMRDGRHLRFADWRFIHRARLNCVALNGVIRTRNELDKRCRKCNHTLETLPHVINHCPASMQLIRQRHDDIQALLVRGIPPTLGEIREDQRVPQVNSNLRPDVVIFDENNKKVTMVDIACPFENGANALSATRAGKMNKYEPIAAQLRTNGYSIKLYALVVGALGITQIICC